MCTYIQYTLLFLINQVSHQFFNTVLWLALNNQVSTGVFFDDSHSKKNVILFILSFCIFFILSLFNFSILFLCFGFILTSIQKSNFFIFLLFY